MEDSSLLKILMDVSIIPGVCEITFNTKRDRDNAARKVARFLGVVFLESHDPTQIVVVSGIQLKVKDTR